MDSFEHLDSKDFDLYLAHLKGALLTRDEIGIDILFTKRYLDLQSSKHEWVLKDKVDVFVAIRKLIERKEKYLLLSHEVEDFNLNKFQNLTILASDEDYQYLVSCFKKEMDDENVNNVWKLIKNINLSFQKAITKNHENNWPWLYSTVKNSKEFSKEPKMDTEDVLMDSHHAMLFKLKKYQFIYDKQASFNKYFSRIAKFLWLNLLKLRKKENNFKSVQQLTQEGLYDDNEIYSDELFNQREILNSLASSDSNVKILLDLIKIDSEAENKKSVNDWSETIKNKYVWEERQILLENIGYVPENLPVFNEIEYKKKGEAFLRDKKRVAIKKLEEIFKKRIDFNRKNFEK